MTGNMKQTIVEKSRSKKALYNTSTYLGGMIIEVVVSLILPRLILGRFGSGNNGLTASIEQFLSYTSLLYLGLTGATRAALYKPLSSDDHNSVNRIMATTKQFMQKVTIITFAVLLGFSCIYPFFVNDEFSWGYASSLTLIIGINTLFQYYFGMPCRIILAADQKNYVLTIIDIAALVLSSLVSVVLIYCTDSIHLVKLGAVGARALGPIALHIYVKKHYKLDYTVEPDKDSIKQRWDAGAHSIAQFVNKNTDIVVLTIFTNVKEVSVYAIYYLVINGLNKIGSAFSSGLEGAFGNIIAKGETDSLKKNMSAYETIIYMLSTILYTCCAVLIVPFVKVYTRGVSDVSYDRLLFGYLVSFAGLFSTLRIPYQTVVQAAGKYKETRNGAILEAVFNIAFSVVLVIKFGLVGVTIGTAVAMCFRTVQYAVFSYKNIIHESIWKFIIRNTVMVIQAVVIILIARLLSGAVITTYGQWLLYAVPVFFISACVTVGTAFIFWRKDLKVIVRLIKKAIR